MTIAILSAIAFVVATGLIIGIVRSERIADWIGRTGQRVADWTLHRLGRGGSPNVAGAIHRFRDQLGVVIRRRGLLALLIAIISQFAWAIVLLVGPACGRGPRDGPLHRRDLRVYAGDGHHDPSAVARWRGVSELLFISAFSALAARPTRPPSRPGSSSIALYFWFAPDPDRLDPAQGSPSGPVDAPDDHGLEGYASGSAT